MSHFDNLANHDFGTTVRVVLFDAVGTVIELRHSVADCYYSAAQAAGIEISKDIIRQRFPDAFARNFTAWQQQLPEPWAVWARAWHTDRDSVRDWLSSEATRKSFFRFFSLPIDEEQEAQAWARLVAEVLAPIRTAADPECSNTAFRALWKWFAEPEAWQPVASASALIQRLRAEGKQVGLASNFDRRLNAVMAGLTEELEFDHLFVSSNLGYRKPDPRFYQAILARLQVRPEQVAMIGDRWWEDFAAPTVCGLQASWCGNSER
jgi:putative hydrolase of the HAD superfamily